MSPARSSSPVAGGRVAPEAPHGPARPGDANGNGALWRGLEAGWSAVSYIVAGIVVWGGLGWLADRSIGTYPVLLLVGALVGNFAGIYLIYVRWPVHERDARR